VGHPPLFGARTRAIVIAVESSFPLPAAVGRSRLASASVREFYESFWADAPQDPEPWAYKQRNALLHGELKRGDKVLDFGCGAGRFLATLPDAIGVEIAQQAVDRAKANVPEADVRLLEPDGSLPLGHGEIDLVWCSEVLEHIADVAHALLEMRRVLKPDGRVLITVPYHGRLLAAGIALTRFEAHFDPLGQHLRFFTRRSLAAALEHSGFTRVQISRAQPRMLVARASR
jgi:SAM-dependent methyltransferase